MTPNVEITCPNCGLVSHFDQVRRNSQEFCRKCDFPLFWVRAGDAPRSAESGDDVGLRRLPGAGGRQVVSALGCPKCNEPNHYSATLCIRCGANLRPAPVEPVPVVVVAEEAPPPPPEPEPEIGPVWPYYLLLIGGPIAVALFLLSVIN